MKGLSLTGLLLLALAFILFYFNDNFSVIKLFEPITLMGILAGIGIGLFIGGMIGYVSKGNAVKEAQLKREFKELQKQKAELEKQQAVENINKRSL